MDKQQILSDIKYLLIDMDGVLWRGKQPLPGLPDFFALLRRRGIRFVLVTNNASKTTQHYVERLAGYRIEIKPEQIITSAQATADYLSDQCEPGTPVHVVGMVGLRQSLTARGFHLLEDGAEPGSARYVVVGWDQHLTYEKLAQATLHLNAGAEFIGTNPDPTWPSERGLLPGAGATLAALQTASGVEPTVVGKPSPLMFRVAMRRIGADAASTAMVGDRLATDILGAHDAGLSTILLFSGVTRPDDLENASVRPDLTFDDVAALTQAWQANKK